MNFQFSQIVHFLLDYLLVMNIISKESKQVMADDEDVEYFCYSPTRDYETKVKRCNIKKEGKGMMITQVYWVRDDLSLPDYKCNEKLHPLNPLLTQATGPPKRRIEQACNERDHCNLEKSKDILSKTGFKTYIIQYICSSVVDHTCPINTKQKDTINMRKTEERTVAGNSKVKLFMCVYQESSVHRTCSVSTEDNAKLSIRAGISGEQSDRANGACAGQFQITQSDNKEMFSGNCSNLNTTPFFSYKYIMLIVSMWEGFLWFEIKGPDDFVVACALTKNRSQPEPVFTGPPVTKNTSPVTKIQPVPGTTPVGEGKSTTTIVATASTTGTQKIPEKSKPFPKIILFAVIGASVVVIIVLILLICLCKKRNSPYRKWKNGGKSSSVQNEGHAQGPDDQQANEYTYVVDSEIIGMDERKKQQQNAKNGSYDDVYNEVDESTVVTPHPSRSTRPEQKQLTTEYTVNNNNTKHAIGVSETTYSQVDLPNKVDDDIKTYSSGVYHNTRKKETSLPPGGDTYDVMGARPDEYAHLKDVNKRQQHILDNVYDG